MGYFRELPNIEYLSPLLDRNSSSEYISAKNLFKRIKISDDFQNSITNFEKYQIMDGMRPDQVANELYNSPNLDWVVLITAGITNIRDQWPLADKDIYYFVENAYGSAMNETRFYETIEVKDSSGRLIIPQGKIVDYNFKSPKPSDNSYATSSYVKYWDNSRGEMITIFNITRPVTNYEYEVRLNNEKRSIYVLRPSYLQQFLNDARIAMKYTDSSQYIDERTKIADNIRIKSP